LNLKSGVYNCSEGKEFNPPLQFKIWNLIPGYHSHIGFYVCNKHDSNKQEVAFMYSNVPITTNIVYAIEAKIEETIFFNIKLKPTQRDRYILGLCVYTDQVGVCMQVAEIVVVCDRTLRHQVNGRNSRPNTLRAAF